MYNELVAVVVSPFQGENRTDKNGKDAVWLTPIAGKIPNRAMVVSGTVAERASLVSGTTVLVMIVEADKPDPQYGRRFNHTVLGPVETREIIGLRKELGSPTVVDVTGQVNNDVNGILDNANAGAAVTPALQPLTPGADDAAKTEEEKAKATLANGSQNQAQGNKQAVKAGG